MSGWRVDGGKRGGYGIRTNWLGVGGGGGGGREGITDIFTDD